MIIRIKDHADKAQVDNLVTWLHGMGFDVHHSVGRNSTILGLIGDTSSLDIDVISSLEIVDGVQRVQEPYKNANRKFHRDDSVIDCGGPRIGGGNFMLIAGPCSVETEEQIIEVAQRVKRAGAHMLRGGAFKPRTSPYAFQGLKDEGIRLLLKAKKEVGLPIITEIMDINHLPLFEEVDVIQVGARSMQNFELLKELGQLRKPVLIKRGAANTIQEWLMSAEYVMAGGNENVILCERGIRTFETATRNTLDLSAVPVLHNLTHLPVVVDPSHATGEANLVKSMAMAAAVAGADGVMVEVHNDPPRARCDGKQSLTPDQFDDLAAAINAVLPFACRRDGDKA